MHYKDFIAKYQGKYLDYDKAYSCQCVDLFRYFCKEVLAINQPKGVSGAKDFWTNYSSDPNLYNNFEKIANTPSFVPQPGDVWIWNANYGKYGHIAIESYAKATTSTFQCFSQNDPSGSPCILKNYKYVSVYGVLRPKNQANIKVFQNGTSSTTDNSSAVGNTESEDEMKTLEFLGCKDFSEAEHKLIEHLGIKGDKCAWGTDDGDGTGGFLGSERRKVKSLESDLAACSSLKNSYQHEAEELRGELTTAQSGKIAAENELAKLINANNVLLEEKNKNIEQLQAQIKELKATQSNYKTEAEVADSIFDKLRKLIGL